MVELQDPSTGLCDQDTDHEHAYRDELISQGLDSTIAADIARRLAITKQLPPVELQKPPSAPSPANDVIVKPQQHKITSAGVTIDENAPKPDELAFMHTVMCQVGLPRKAVDSDSYERLSGGVGLYIQAGALWDGKSKQFIKQPVPYGAMPRIVLAHLNSEALRQRSPHVDVGPSANAFLKSLGYSNTGGARGSYTMFKKQVQALAACTIRIGYNVGDRAYTFNSDLIDKFVAWTHGNNPGDRNVMWPESITFSERYYSSLVEHAVPLDMRALHALKGSALCLDVYAMMVERLHRLDRPLVLHWSSLREQFGHEYHGVDAGRNFKKRFLTALVKVQTVYPKANIRVVNTGISLKPSPPPIAPRSQ